MKSNVNVFVGVVLCAVLCGMFVWLRSAGEEDTWKPNEIYDQVHSSSYGSSYTNATFSGSPQEGGLAVSMSSSSSMRARHATNFYAGAGYAPTASSTLSSSVSLLPSSHGGAAGAGLYATSSAELKSFGGGGNGGTAMGGAARGNSVSSASLQGGAGVGFVSSPIAYSTAHRGEMSSTSGTNPAMLDQQGVTPDMASASSFGYAAASSYMNAGVNDQYNAINGSSNGRSNVRGRQGAGAPTVGGNNWWFWLDQWVKGTSYGKGGDKNGDGYADDGYLLDEKQILEAYEAFIEGWNDGMGEPPTPEQWWDWYYQYMYANGGEYWYNGHRYFWTPVGDVLPLVLLAMLYIAFMALKSQKVSATLKSLFVNNKNNK